MPLFSDLQLRESVRLTGSFPVDPTPREGVVSESNRSDLQESVVTNNLS
jgi:hypothetical protein